MRLGWSESPIGDVALPAERFVRPLPGAIYRQVGVRLWGQGAYEREPIDGGDTKYVALNRTECGDIVVNKIWARHGSVSVISNGQAGCYVSGEFPLFVPSVERLEPRWFYWITRTRWFWERCDEQSRGTSGKNRIRPERFLSITIPLPPVEEQRRIVAKIERLAAKIAEAYGLQRQARQAMDALLDSALREFYSSAHSAEWDTLRVEELCEFGPQNGLFKKRHQFGSGVRLLNVADAYKGTLVPIATLERVQADGSEIDQFRLERGDVCIVRSSIKDTGIGRACLFDGADEPVVFECHLMRLRLEVARIMPRLFVEFFNRPIGKEQILANRRAAVMTTINQRDLRSLTIPVPPLDEQRCMVAYLDSLQTKVDHLKGLQEQTAAELDALLPSILDKAFKGEL